LEQGLSTIEATVTASEPLPAVVPLQPILLPIPTIRSPHQFILPPHQFILPQNTIDQARTRSKPHIQPPHTPQISQFQFIVPPSPYIISPPPTTPIPKSTKRASERRRAKKHWLVSLHGVIKSERPLLSVPNVARIELTNSDVKSLEISIKKRTSNVLNTRLCACK
jgi:hypothetical protein